MKKIKSFAVVGGDARQIYMSHSLSEQGYSFTLCGFDKYGHGESSADLSCAIKNSDAVILPIPVSRDNMTITAPYSDGAITFDELLSLVDSSQVIFAGMMSADRRSAFFKKGIRVYDYADRDEFAIKNAVPTAEGIIAIISDTLPVTIKGTNIVITGYGKTARAAAKALSSLSAHVTVAARRCSSLAMADNEGYESIYISELHRYADKFDVLINTVPELIVTADILEKLRRDCLVAEIASAPYGIDLNAARKLGLNVVVAGSLPGKVAPKSAGNIISETIQNIIREGSE